MNALFARSESFAYKLLQKTPGMFPIGVLAPFGLARDGDKSVAGHAMSEAPAEQVLLPVSKHSGAQDIPLERCLGLHFVHILTARPAAPAEEDFQFAIGNREPFHISSVYLAHAYSVFFWYTDDDHN